MSRNALGPSGAVSGFLLSALALVVPGGLGGPAPLEAQTECEVLESNFMRRIAAGAGGEIVFVSRPVARCDDGTRIQADSAEIYSARSLSRFFGSVRFQEADKLLTSNRADFFSRQGRLQAWGRVVLTDRQDGSRITGDTLVYLRATADRPEERMTVSGGRPHATVYPRGPGAPGPEETGPVTPERTADTAPTPYEVDADRIFLEGERYFRATGDVVIVRDSLEALADSVEHDRQAGRLTLVEDAQLLGDGYVLTGRTVTLLVPGDEIREVVSRDEAVLSGEGLRLTAPLIRLFLQAGSLERTVALGPRSGTPPPTPTGRAGPLRPLPADSAADTSDPELPPGADVPPPARRLIRGLPGELPGDRRSAEGEERSDPPPGEGAGDPEEGEGELPGTRNIEETGIDGPPIPADAPQPRAVTDEFVLTADSIEALSPHEELERVTASGRARGESTSRDSLNTEATPDVARRDWLEGDTIVASFVPDTDSVAAGAPGSADSLPAAPVTPADSGRAGYRLDRIRAAGHARSLYRLEPSDSAASGAATTGLSLHFVQGDRILIVMEAGRVGRMEVEGETRGLYLEPRRAGSEPRDGRAAPGGAEPPAGRRDGARR